MGLISKLITSGLCRIQSRVGKQTISRSCGHVISKMMPDLLYLVCAHRKRVSEPLPTQKRENNSR